MLHLSGDSSAALLRLADLADELKVQAKSGGALIGALTSNAYNGILYGELWTYQANMDIPADEWKTFAQSYAAGEYYSEAITLGMRQEFQFLQIAVSDVSLVGAAVFEHGFLEKPSELQVFIEKVLVYAGLRKTRTVNEVFQVYSEIVDQAHLPRRDRSQAYAEQIEIKLSRGGELSSLMNRNPYGRVLLSILYPATHNVFNVVDRSEASASATRLSMALQAYYLNKGTLPETLGVLVPDYLAAIPRDPFDGEPMRYSKEKKIVYSVGNDFIDQGGSEKSFIFKMDPDDNYEAAEYDDTEPTFPLRFAM